MYSAVLCAPLRVPAIVDQGESRLVPVSFIERDRMATLQTGKCDKGPPEQRYRFGFFAFGFLSILRGEALTQSESNQNACLMVWLIEPSIK